MPFTTEIIDLSDDDDSIMTKNPDDKMVDLVEIRGNTKKRISPSKRWCFTLNNPELVEMGKMVGNIELSGGQWVYGVEYAPTTKTRHLQGYIEWDHLVRPVELLDQWAQKAHWEKCKGNQKSNWKYCTKDGNWNACRSWYDKIEEMIDLQIKDPMLGLTLRPWQEDIRNIINRTPDDRIIYWFWDRKGNVGKTTFCKHLCLKYNAIMLSGKASDIKSGVASHVEKNGGLKIAIFHYVRSNEDYVSYDALESIKDGIFFSGKYESGMVMFNTPHVIVFANFEPDRSKMSLDRWVINEIK